MSRETEPSNENEALAAVEAIQAKISGILADLTRAHEQIQELIPFLRTCGYGLNQQDLHVIEGRIATMVTELTSIRNEY